MLNRSCVLWPNPKVTQVMLDVLLRLFTVFAPLSFLTVGGGQSIIPAIYHQSVEVQRWIDNSQFLDLFALSRLTPGPKSLLVTLIGWQAAGWAGAIIASVAIFLPSAVLVYFLARVWKRFEHAVLVQAIEAGLIPVAAGMILAATGIILNAAEGGFWAWAVALSSAGLLLSTRISPFVLLGAGGVIFLLVQPRA